MRFPFMGSIAGLVWIAVAGVQSSAAEIPDKNLEAAIRMQVAEKRDSDKELTDEDLRKVFVLEAKGRGIRDLTGIEKCTNLLQANLAKNEVADLKPLAELTNIQSLDVSNNKIADIEPLSKLTALQYLELSGNEIDKLAPLAEHKKLAALYAADNKVQDVSPVAGLAKLASLDLSHNEIKDVGPLAKLTGLSLLKLNDNAIENVAPLAEHPPVGMLLIERNKISDLAPLVASAEADSKGEQRFAPFLRLYLEGNPLSDKAKKEQLPALKKAGVRILSPKES